MSGLLYRWGAFAGRRPMVVIGAWVVMAVLVVGAANSIGRDFEDSFDVPGLDSQQAVDLLSAAESDRAGLTARVLVKDLDGRSFFESEETVAAVADLQRSLLTLPNVLSASDPAAALSEGPEFAVSTGTVSPDGTIAMIGLQYPVVDELSRDDLHNLKDLIADAPEASVLQIESGGDLFFSFEEPETGLGEAIGVVAAVIILLLAFGSVVAMGLPIGMALFGLVLGVSSMSLIAYLINVPSWAPQIGSMVGLGVGIDYALFLVTRYREFLARGMVVPDAVGRATATAGQAVIFAGGTVVIAILGLGVAGVPFMTAAGVSTSMIVLIMVLASVTLLPAMLGLFGHRINRLTVGRGARQFERSATGSVGDGWQRWGRHVSNHAWAYAVGVTALLLAMTAPVLWLQLGFPDEGTLPESRTERRAYDLVAEGFGPGSNGPLIIAVDLTDLDLIDLDLTESDLTESDPAGSASSGSESAGNGTERGGVGSGLTTVDELALAIGADPGIAAVAPPEINAEAGVATVVAFPTTSPQDEATLETVTRLRAEVFPVVLADTDVRAHVGGTTAAFGDIAAKVTDRLPAFIAAVIGLSFLLLTLVFRSILVPLKAALLNLLSIGAAYGVLVMVFQWGWGTSLIGLETTVPIVSFIPMFMFAILFGLSMDYEVFLLSRVREEYLITGDNDGSVIHGIASTARVITSAALIMISVFGGFVLGSDPTTKMFGLGLATAIFVDATIVRMVLVPATMKLMGDANWWIPGWLDRLLPTIDIEGEAGLPDPVMEQPSIVVEPDRDPSLV